MLEEIGKSYETVVLDFGPKMKTAEYLAINPMGKVPALKHGDRVITECAAICAYLAHTFPEARLVPEDRSSFYRWLFFGAGPVDMASADARRGVVIADAEKGHCGYGSFDDVVRVLADHLRHARYFCGDQFSAVDVVLGSSIGFGLEFGTLPNNVDLVAYWDRIKCRSARLRALQLDEALMAGAAG